MILLNSLKTSPFTRVFLILFFLIFFPQVLSWNLYHSICFYYILFLNIIKSFKDKTTFIACFYFFYIILKSLQRCQISFKNLFTFTRNTRFATSLEYTVQYIGTSNISNSGSFEYLAHFCMTQNFFFEYWV